MNVLFVLLNIAAIIFALVFAVWQTRRLIKAFRELQAENKARMEKKK